MRVFALSDIHVDYAENLHWLKNISTTHYRDDTLLLAGDATHDLARLREAFDILLARFRHVFFVPGNHELWVMKGERGNSLDKFQHILALCKSMGVGVEPAAVGEGANRLWIVPLFSWYTLPEQGDDSLYLPKRGGDQGLKVWSDTYFVKWPEQVQQEGPGAYFLRLNEQHVHNNYDAPVISFSHFLGRQDLLFTYGTDVQELLKRAAEQPPSPNESGDGFNFSRVAGSSNIDQQVRQLKSGVHVHGHQHRNRFRVLDGILYVSHCLGYKHERNKGILPQIEQGPLKIWDNSPSWDPMNLTQY